MIESPNDKLLNLILPQYYDSPNLIKYLQVFTDMSQDIYNMLNDVILKRQYENAENAQLDVIGYLVGAGKRNLEGVENIPLFGYYESIDTLGAGDDIDRDVGGLLSSDNGLPIKDLPLNDKLFRQWIEARIVKNSTRCDIEDIILFIELLLGRELDIEITEPAPAAIHVRLHTTLELVEMKMFTERLGHIKPIGVSMTAEDDAGMIIVKIIGY